MSKNAWLTPDAPTELICRRVLVPNTLVYALNGAIGNLGDVWNWEGFGGLTEEQAAGLGFEIFGSIEDCELDKRMIGSIQFYAGALPAGVLLCDGQSYDEIDYPDLYAALGGVGGVFSVPDLRGRFIIGADGTYPVGDVGGAVNHSLSIAELPVHDHLSHSHDVNVDIESPVGVPDVGAGVGLPDLTGSSGGGLAHNNMPPYFALTPGIVALPVVVTGGGVAIEVGIVVDEKSQGVHGGTFDQDLWIKRDINTLRASPSWLSVSSDEITLLDGSYVILATLPARNVTRHKARMVRVSDSVVFDGQSSWANSPCMIFASIEVVGSEVFYFEHRCLSSQNTNGLGGSLGSGVETYTQVMVLKYG